MVRTCVSEAEICRGSFWRQCSSNSLSTPALLASVISTGITLKIFPEASRMKSFKLRSSKLTGRILPCSLEEAFQASLVKTSTLLGGNLSSFPEEAFQASRRKYFELPGRSLPNFSEEVFHALRRKSSKLPRGSLLQFQEEIWTRFELWTRFENFWRNLRRKFW